MLSSFISTSKKIQILVIGSLGAEQFIELTIPSYSPSLWGIQELETAGQPSSTRPERHECVLISSHASDDLNFS